MKATGQAMKHKSDKTLRTNQGFRHKRALRLLRGLVLSVLAGSRQSCTGAALPRVLLLGGVFASVGRRCREGGCVWD